MVVELEIQQMVKPFSIQQHANDTAGLLDALNVQKTHVLGYSLGSFIAQQFAIMYPEKVDRFILAASRCGGKESIPPPLTLRNNNRKF
jgi:pimeloyl-ACP methyl ester carboxylesterase